MAYTPKTWTTGETITAAELNAIEQAASTIAAAADTANAGLAGKVNSSTYTAGLAGKAPQLIPTATKTAAYTAAVGDLAVMNVAGGATALTLPTAPADKSMVGFLAVSATSAAPLTVNRGGTDTVGPSGATSVTAPLANEVTVYQYDATNTRWLPVSNVKPLTALDGRYPQSATLGATVAADPTVKATYGAATVGNRLRRAANNSARKDGLLPVMTTPPTITTGTSNPDATLTKAFRVSTSNANVFRFVGAIPIAAIYASLYQTFYSATKPTGTGGNTPGHASTSTYGWAVEFYSDAPKVALRALGTSTGYMVEVNDQPIAAAVLAQASTSGTQYMLLDFTSAGGAAIRKFRVEFTQASAWDGVYVGPTYNVWAPVSDTNLRVVSVGDSVCASTGITLPGGHWQNAAAKILGWTDVRQDAWGGSGFTLAGSGTTFGDPIRVADAVASSPDLLLISATGNDNSQPGVQAAALAAFQAYRTALPTVPIVVTGVDTYPGGTAMTTLQATETTVKAAFDQWADANSWFVPITNDASGPWQFGSGNTGTPTSNGIADRLSADGTHPNDLGHSYLGQRFANAFRTLVLPKVA